MRDSMVFYKSFFECIAEFPLEERDMLYNAIFRYVFYGEEPQLTGVLRGVFLSFKPQIDVNNKRYENGKKGGRPRGNKTKEKPKQNQTITKTKPNDNQNETKEKPNVNVNVNANDNENNNRAEEERKKKDNERKKQARELFEILWQQYPHKKGKGGVSDTGKMKLLKVGQEELERAIERYKHDLENETWRKPQYGSTFFNGGYIDYLDSNYTGGGNIGNIGTTTRPKTEYNPSDYGF